MSFIEELRRQKAEEIAKKLEAEKIRAAERAEEERRRIQQIEREKARDAKREVFKNSLVLNTAREISTLLPVGSYEETETRYLHSDCIGQARLKWLFEWFSDGDGGVDGSFEIYGNEDGTVRIGQTTLTAEEAEQIETVDQAFEVNCKNPTKRENFFFHPGFEVDPAEQY